MNNGRVVAGSLGGLLAWSLACGGGAAEPEPEPETPDAPLEEGGVEGKGKGKGKGRGKGSRAEVGETHQHGDFYDPACASCGGACESVRVSASSSLKEGSVVHGPERVLDGDRATAWCEGVDGDGKGESLTFELPAGCRLYGLQLWAGYFKDERRLKDNGRPARVTLRSGREERVFAIDDPVLLEHDTSGRFPESLDLTWFERARGYPAFVDPAFEALGSTLTITIQKVHPGAKASDTCISDVDIMLFPPDE